MVEGEGFEVVFAEGLEGAEADVEGDFGDGGLNLGEDFWSEVEAGGGSGGGTGVFGEDGLVAFFVA